MAPLAPVTRIFTADHDGGVVGCGRARLDARPRRRGRRRAGSSAWPSRASCSCAAPAPGSSSWSARTRVGTAPDRPQQRRRPRRHLLRARARSRRGCASRARASLYAFCERARRRRPSAAARSIVALDDGELPAPGRARAPRRAPTACPGCARLERRTSWREIEPHAARRRRAALARHRDRRLRRGRPRAGRRRDARRAASVRLGCAVDRRSEPRRARSCCAHAGGEPRGAARRRLRRRVVGPAGGRRAGAPRRPAHRAVPRRLPAAAARARADLVRGADLPGARPAAAVPRRPPHPPHRRRGARRADRAARARDAYRLGACACATWRDLAGPGRGGWRALVADGLAELRHAA